MLQGVLKICRRDEHGAKAFEDAGFQYGMDGKALARSFPQFLKLLDIDERIPIRIREGSDGLGHLPEEFVLIPVLAFGPEFLHVPDHNAPIDGVVRSEGDVIRDNRMGLWQLVTLMPQDLNVLVHQNMPVPFVCPIRNVRQDRMGREDDLAFCVSGSEVIGDRAGYRSLHVIPVEDMVPGRHCLGKQLVPNCLLDKFLRGLENQNSFSRSGKFASPLNNLISLSGPAGG